jgi:peroxiredoxin Q/BCP
MELDVIDELENKPAPDFLLQIDDNSEISLENFKGKFLILFFYPKDNTPGCTTEAKDFARLHDQFKSHNAVVVGVSPDNIKSHNNFKNKHCLPFNLAYDRDVSLASKYHCWVEKSMYGKKYMGIERTTILIDLDGIVRKIWRKLSVTNHAELVLKTLVSIC